MGSLRNIFIAISMGIAVGVVIGGLKSIFRKKTPSQEQIEFMRRLINRFAIILKYSTISLLVIGLLWCIYFLLLGITVPAQAEYADNMAELIVSVLTVISIIFAFVEFIRPKDKK
ncbi:transporter [Anaerostipes sp.]|uniref:transporter n=1 Tax=Anaerostipes sp. TaxID=1872530 RepID=UPI0025BE630D|nr:transporter [Anaerostipes sp.]MBS7008073.1 transporter [Anaerostipes sp.]